jgi:tRNA (guanine37-N1)-methyltransferase
LSKKRSDKAIKNNKKTRPVKLKKKVTKKTVMSFYVLTLFPEFIKAFTDNSIIKRGIEKKAFKVVTKDIRENAINKHRQVDDQPYGGGPGMLLRPEPVIKTFKSLKLPEKERKVIFFSPKGRKLDLDYINGLTNFKNIVLICGHYEGIDQRVIDNIVDDEVSVGDYVLTGGELPAMLLIDAVARHIDGVIKEDSLKDESFSNGLLEHRQYTRPPEYLKMKVPDVLISGDHKKIQEYKLRDSIRETMKKRPDLLKEDLFDDKIRKVILSIRKEFENELHE